MAGNTFGKLFQIITFGESHGLAIGCVVDGCPSGVVVDEIFLQKEMDRRRPGQSSIVTQRKESDTVQLLSGVFEGKTLGTPIALLIPNEDAHSKDYDHLKDVYRPSHADFTWQVKYGHRDHRGGGRSSARETAARVAGGAIAKMFLLPQGVYIQAFTKQVGNIVLEKQYSELDLSTTDDNMIRCPDAVIAARMIQYVEEVRKAGDTVGGVITCVVRGVPVGLGEPVFDKLHADLAKAMMSINAVKGFEIGSGFEGTRLLGSQHNDGFVMDGENLRTTTNNSGGIQGGISNGMDIYFNVAFKPVATVMQPQATLNTEGEKVMLQGKGRHDPCVLPRAVPIVEAMAALVIADHVLRCKVLISE